jgi:Rad3-related DNA helicase
MSPTTASYANYVLPAPSALGFDRRFSSYRTEQIRAIIDVTDSPRRHRVLAAPTGIGKSICGISIGLLQQARTLILTSTKALQSQYMRDAEALGMVDIRGASNYSCPALERGGDYAYLRGSGPATADRGPCLSGMSCKLRNGGCPKYDALAAAKSSELVVTNYDYWLSAGKALRSDDRGDREETLGDFDYLIYDEMHSAADHVQKSMHLELDLGAVRTHLSMSALTQTDTIDEWRRWGQAARLVVATRLDEIARRLKLARDDNGMDRELIDELNELRKLDRVLLDVSDMYGKWVVERIGTHVHFDPVWVDRYVEQKLFRGIPNVVGMSATVRPAEMRYLGVPDTEFDFFEYDSPFPVSNRPVYRWPIARMHYGMSEELMAAIVRKVDEEFISKRLDRKGLIQAVSYKRARQIYNYSSYRQYMIQHDPRSTARAIETFKNSPAPAIFDSPSVATGYDFPDDDARWVWIPKVPYPSTESALMKAKVETDKAFTSFYAAKEIVQMCGRIVRGMRDWGEAVITDTAFAGLMNGAGYLNFPKFFLQALKYSNNGAPRPLRRIN